MGHHLSCLPCEKGFALDVAGSAETELCYKSTSVTSVVNDVELFKNFPREEQSRLLEACERIRFLEGQVLSQQGDQLNALFIIMYGQARVDVDGRQIAILGYGDHFGEKALLHEEFQEATITAVRDMETLKITRERFKQLHLNENLNFQKRPTVRKKLRAADKPRAKAISRPPATKTASDKLLITNALCKNPLLDVFGMNEDTRNKLIDAMWKEKLGAGTEIIREGGTDGSYFYIVADGCFEVLKNEDELIRNGALERIHSAPVSKTADSGLVEVGGSFGVLGVFNLASTATLRAKVVSTVWVIDHVQFREICMRKADDLVMTHMEYLDSCELLTCLGEEDKLQVAQALTEVTFMEDETILEEGIVGNTCFLLYEGELSQSKDGKQKHKLKASGGKVIVLGELAVLRSEAHPCTITVRSPRARALSIDKVALDVILGPAVMHELMEADIMKNDPASSTQPKATRESRSALMSQKSSVYRTASTATVYSVKSSAPGTPKAGPRSSQFRVSVSVSMGLSNAGWDSSRAGRTPVYKDELVTIGVLGTGGFGTVFLAQHSTTKQSYAMKKINKGWIVECGAEAGVLVEKEVLQMCKSPFICNLIETYNTDKDLWFLLELASAGDLFNVYHQKGFFGEIKPCKFYTAGAICALEHLHIRKVLYRDMKLENLMINEEGQPKLTDFGLSKICIGKTYTVCGTPVYFAPEIIELSGHDQSYDWWCLGNMIFEMMRGQCAFFDFDEEAIFRKVQEGIDKVKFPMSLRGDGENLVKKLLVREPSERLPMLKGGVRNIKEHSWYSGFNWSAFQARTMPPPWVPTSSLISELKERLPSYPNGEDNPLERPYTPDGTGWDEDFATCP